MKLGRLVEPEAGEEKCAVVRSRKDQIGEY